MKTVSEKVDPKSAALVVIDMQNDFCHEDGTSAARGFDAAHVQAIVPNLQRLLEKARDVGIPIVFARVSLTDETVADNFKERSQGRPFPCREGSWGAEWYGVMPNEGETIVTKRRFSTFIGTDFDLTLRVLGRKSLILAGTRTNVCVESTARDGYQHDYYITVLSDCTAASDYETHVDALNRMEKSFGVVATSADVMSAWDQLLVPAVST